MKKTKRRELTKEDIQQELVRVTQELQAEQATRATAGKPKNPGRFRALKRWKATLLFLQAQKSKTPAPSTVTVESVKS